MRLYLDSAAVIYLVQQVAPYSDLVEARLAGREVLPFTSELTRLECRVKPLREQNAAVLKDFDEFFEEAFDFIVPLSRETCRVARLVPSASPAIP